MEADLDFAGRGQNRPKNGQINRRKNGSASLEQAPSKDERGRVNMRLAESHPGLRDCCD
jgi:hypothetical protein